MSMSEWVAVDIETSPDPALEKYAGDPLIVPVYKGLPKNLIDGPKTDHLVDHLKIEQKEAAWQVECDGHKDKWADEYNKKCSLDPFLFQVHMITAYRRQSQVSFTTEHQTEEQMLESFFAFMLGRTGEVRPMITFNGRRFDAKLLQRVTYFYPSILKPGELRLLREKWLGPPWKTEAHHIDMCEELNNRSLAFCAKRLLGMEKGKGGGRHPETPEEWAAETEYCMHDSRITYQLAAVGHYILPDGDVEIGEISEDLVDE